MKKTKEQKQLEARVEKCFKNSCMEILIPIMKLSEVYSLGESLAKEGKTDEEIETEMRVKAQSFI